MSRAYRISVSETLHRVIRAGDHVSCQLEILEVLPAAQMADLLAQQLIEKGFEREGNTCTRVDGDITVTLDLATGKVTVKAESSEEVDLKGSKGGVAYDDEGPTRKKAEADLRDELAKDLEEDAERQTENLQKQMTDQLEAELTDLRSQLDQAVNRATAEALKQKAARIGQIKEMTDDPQTGSLTIVIEV